MKVVINKCFGGFSLSAKAIQRLAELQGRPCFFFKRDITRGLSSPYEPITVEEADSDKTFMFSVFDVPNPNEVLPRDDKWHEMTQGERIAHNKAWAARSITSRPDNRADAYLVRVVQELGEDASGKHAALAIVEIPDGTEYVIEEYDGNEHIAEVHQTWR